MGWHLDTYTNAASALKGIPASMPQVVLMDVILPDLSGIDCARELKARLPELPVLMFTAQADAGALLIAMMAGACGYLIKPVAPDDLRVHLLKAAAGGLALCGRAERLLLESMREVACATGIAYGLSRSESELMMYLCQRRSYKECAAALGISKNTVHVHLQNVYGGK